MLCLSPWIFFSNFRVRHIQQVCSISTFFIIFTYASTNFAASFNIQQEERLSQWLRQHQTENVYPLGFMWLVPSEKPAQSNLKQRLMDQLSSCLKHQFRTRCKKPYLMSLITRLNQLPVTGRARIAMADPYWLTLNPAQDPVLEPGQGVSLPERPLSITVLMDNSQLCQVPFIRGATADVYIKLCLGQNHGVDYAWVAQPDGQVFRYGIALWNEEAQNPPAPGAWIWAPTRSGGFQYSVSDDMVRFLATQGPAPDLPLNSSHVIFPEIPLNLRWKRKRNEPLTANDWGIIGLMEMPSARMEKNSELRFQLTNVYPYRIGTLMFQVFDWLEGGFHYARIATQLYGPQISKLALYDKGFDLKLRLLKERAYLPQIAVGGQDMVGTANFSGEYIVASKRIRDFDWTLGVAWGNLGGRNNIANPLVIIDNNFNFREGMLSEGGTFNTTSYFHGPASVFGGVQWHSPWDPLIFKLEYDASHYQIGQIEQYWPQKTPINVGLVYRLFSILDLAAGLERGNTLMLGLTLHTALNELNQAKILDPLPPPIKLIHKTSTNTKVKTKQSFTKSYWLRTATEINTLTGWSVMSITMDGDRLCIHIDGARTSFGGSRLNSLIRVLNQDAPLQIKRFVVTFFEYGMKLDEKVIDRARWLKEHTQALPPSLALPSVISYAPPFNNQTTPSKKPKEFLLQSKYLRFSGTVAPVFSQIIGGPNSFFLYQAGVYGSGDLKLTPSTSVSGTALLRLLDNYNGFVYDAPSNLPRVRTDMRRYVETSWNNIPNLQLTQAKQLSRNHFVIAYGGLLEMMFAGVGGEWLYRPWHSPLAFGVDINYVRQRGYAQHFEFQDYRTTTGQMTLYWNTGWNGVLTQFSAGQYLAGDRGGGIDVSRRFNNGVVVGVYAYKTNVSAAQYGEGSFTKGAYISIPFDTIMPISMPGSAYFNWQPLLRDGGAQLNRAIRLYDLTSERSRNASYFDP